MLPLTRNTDYGMGMATALRSLALGIKAGLPINQASPIASMAGPTNHLRVRLQRFDRDVEAGCLPHKAAEDARLGSVCVSALRMVERGEDAEKALNHAADYYDAIARRWGRIVAAISVPLVTIITAFFVGFVVLALFTPLIALIDGVMDGMI